MQYIETITGGVDSINKNSMLNTPLPVVVFRADNGEIIWANDSFVGLADAQDSLFDMTIHDLAPDFNYQWVLDGNQPWDVAPFAGGTYQIYASRGKG